MQTMLKSVDLAASVPDDASDPPRPLGPRALQKEQTRSRILQAALEAFAERGYDGAGIRDIAARVGVNHALIKYHFVDKETLWKAAVAFLFDRLEREVVFNPPSEAGLSELDRLKNWIRRYVRYCARHPEHARIMVQVSMTDGPRLAWAAGFIKREHDDGLATMHKHIRMGIWPDMPAHSLIYIVVAACQTIFALAPEVRHVHGIDVMTDEAIDAHAETVIKLFFDHRAADRHDG